jgi:hypothetical protein
MRSRRGDNSRSDCNQITHVPAFQPLTPAQAVRFKAEMEKTNEGDPADWRPFREKFERLDAAGSVRIKKLSQDACRFITLALAPEYQQWAEDYTQWAYAALLKANPLINEVKPSLLRTAAIWRFNNDYRRGKLFVSQGPIKPRPEPRAPAAPKPPDPARTRRSRASTQWRHRPSAEPVNVLPKTPLTDRDIDSFSSAWAEANRRGTEAGLIIQNLGARVHLSRRDQYLLVFYKTHHAIKHNAWTAEVMTGIGFPMTAHQIDDAKRDLFRRLRNAAKLSLPPAAGARVQQRVLQQLAEAFQQLFNGAIEVVHPRPQLPAAALQHLRAQLPKQRAELDRRLDRLFPAKPAAPAPRKSVARVKKQPQVLSAPTVPAGQVSPFAPAPAL